jgi:large subunit ribosomal protein L7Ae
MEFSKEIIDKALEAVEIAKKTGKIKKGINEATKVVEKGIAKLVLVAKDVNPEEIIMHLDPLCKEKGITLIKVNSKEELGTAAGLSVSTTSVAIVNEGDSKKLIKEITEKITQIEKPKEDETN